MARAVFNLMAAETGVIVNIGSIDGITGNAAEYSASKAGLLGLTKSLAIMGAPRSSVACVSPGPVLTREAMKNMKTLLGRAADLKRVDLVLYPVPTRRLHHRREYHDRRRPRLRCRNFVKINAWSKGGELPPLSYQP